MKKAPFLSILSVIFFLIVFCSCDTSEKQASQLLEKALLNIRLAAEEKKNLPRVIYFQQQALELFNQLEREYGATNTAKILLTGELIIGDLPYAAWREELVNQTKIIGRSDTDLLAFSYALGLLHNDPSRIALVANRYVKAGEIEIAKVMWKSVNYIINNTLMTKDEKAKVFKIMADGKIDAGLYKEAKDDALAGGKVLIMAKIAHRLRKTGAKTEAQAIVDQAIIEIRQKPRANLKGMLIITLINEANFSIKNPAVHQIIKSLISADTVDALVRHEVERLSAIAFYHGKTGDKKTAKEYFDLAVEAAAKEENLSRKFPLFLDLSRIMYNAGQKIYAKKTLNKLARLAMKLPAAPKMDRDLAFGQIAEMAAFLEDESGAMAACLKIEDYDSRRNTYFLVYKQNGRLAPLKMSLELAKKEENPLKIADALCDTAGWYLGNNKPDRALE